MKTDDERIIHYWEAIRRFRPKPETTARDLERARQVVLRQASIRHSKGSTVLSRLIRSKVLRVAAVLCVGAVMLVALLDKGMELDGSKAALARVVEAMNRMPVLHEVYQTTYGRPEVHQTETWYNFNSRTVLAKYFTDGRCVKIKSLNYDTMEEVVYEPNAGVVKIIYHCDIAPDGYPDSPAHVVQRYVSLYGSRGAQIDRERSTHNGIEVDVYRFNIEANEHRHKEQATIVVDRRTSLPLAKTCKSWGPNGEATFDQTMTFDFPAAGPQDIYAIGAPRTAQVILDVASKQRYEKKQSLERMIPKLKERFERSLDSVYRLADGQVLALIPPALVQPRLEWEQAEDEVRRLAQEQERERIARSRPGQGRGAKAGNGRGLADSDQALPRFQCFTWDDGIDMQKGRPVFVGPASIKGALGGIVRLSVFEYEIPAELADVNIPGDWIVRKNSSWEERLAAFEAIVQDYTGRAIRLRPHQVQREVIVARGRFHFQPLSGTYNDSWIHVYADRLDPDERSGGGGGSLEKFVRCLGEVAFDQQVIDETKSDPDVEVHYGWHMSGYIRTITDENERAVKLQMALDNVSRQTGFSFSIEQREVIVWRVVEENPPE